MTDYEAPYGDRYAGPIDDDPVKVWINELENRSSILDDMTSTIHDLRSMYSHIQTLRYTEAMMAENEPDSQEHVRTLRLLIGLQASFGNVLMGAKLTDMMNQPQPIMPEHWFVTEVETW